MNNYIFNNKNIDLFKIFMVFPLAWSILFIQEEVYLKYLSLVVLLFFDYNHIFTTFVRTKDKSDLIEVKRKLPRYILLTVGVLVLSVYFSYNFLINLAIYYNFYHIYKQHEGLVKWYLKKDKSNEKISLINILRFSVLFFVLSVHFKPNFFINIFSNVENKSDFLFHVQDPYLFNIFYMVSITILIMILSYSFFKIIKKNYLMANYYSIFMILTYFFSGFIAQNVFQLYIIHALVHGLHYLFIIWKSDEIIRSGKRKNNYKNMFLFFVLSVIFLLLESKFESFLNIYVFSIIYFIPQWVHYYLDSFLWKNGNKNWSKISS